MRSGLVSVTVIAGNDRKKKARYLTRVYGLYQYLFVSLK